MLQLTEFLGMGYKNKTQQRWGMAAFIGKLGQTFLP